MVYLHLQLWLIQRCRKTSSNLSEYGGIPILNLFQKQIYGIYSVPCVSKFTILHWFAGGKGKANLHGSCQSDVVWKCLCIPDTLYVYWRVISYFCWFTCMHRKLVFPPVPSENRWRTSSSAAIVSVNQPLYQNVIAAIVRIPISWVYWGCDFYFSGLFSSLPWSIEK